MSYYWLVNMIGGELTDDQFKDIPNPKLELITHVTTKNVQAFGILGAFIVGPIVSVVKKVPMKVISTRYGRNGIILGLFLGPVMTLGRLKSVEDAGYDRCYRLRHNRNQIRVDQMSVVGGAAGAIGLGLLKQGFLFGGLVGMSLGVLAATAQNLNLEKEKRESKGEKK